MRINWFFIILSVIVIAAIVLLWYKFAKRNRPFLPDVESDSEADLMYRGQNIYSTVQRPTLLLKPDLTATLRELLISGNWKEADQETLRIMLLVSNREEEGWLDVESVQSFPPDILHDIDQLWLNSSNGQFGFSIQRDTWVSVGGNLDAGDKIYKAFSDRIGWHVDEKWLQIEDLNFDISSPDGHLPALAIRQGGLSWGVDGFWWEKREAYVFLLSQKDW